jgi:hypothetical protein
MLKKEGWMNGWIIYVSTINIFLYSILESVVILVVHVDFLQTSFNTSKDKDASEFMNDEIQQVKK